MKRHDCALIVSCIYTILSRIDCQWGGSTLKYNCVRTIELLISVYFDLKNNNLKLFTPNNRLI